MTEQQKKILSRCNSIPVDALVKYLLDGTVLLSDLTKAGLKPDKLPQLKNALSVTENRQWDEARSANSPKAYADYLRNFPDGQFADDASRCLALLEDDAWFDIGSHPTEQKLREYCRLFPDGLHIGECRSLLDDLPWLQAKEQNTIQAYEDYMAVYPGVHDQEAKDSINNLNDDRDWENACIRAETFAYEDYVRQHPAGRHVDEAERRITANAGKDELLNALRENPNSYSADEIQEKVDNNVASWDDITAIFDETKCQAIKNFVAPSPLPDGNPPEELSDDTTEIYFWGTPSSGKTCALGSIISSVQNKGMFEPLECTGRHYMNILSNIFTENGVCVFPDSTGVENVQEMIMNIRDEKGKPHKVTFIDLAGELFRSVYFQRQRLFLSDDRKRTLDTVLDYLSDETNKKIHFFVVEYGAQEKKWDGLKMVNYLDEMITFLKDEKVFRKSTDGVYILVTKCDMIPCEREERPRLAAEYIKQYLPSFWNTLKITCEQAGVKDVKILSYSVGDVFARNLCIFDSSDTDKVITKILEKTKPRGGLFSWLLK